MITQCGACDLVYDDTYRWTFCPHDDFDMATMAFRPGKPPVDCTTLEQLNEILDGTNQD